MLIKDRWVVVTGAGSGLGYATAQYLGGQGAKLILLDQCLENSKIKGLANNFECMLFSCDITQTDQLTKVFSEIDSAIDELRVCINCAGIATAAKILGKSGIHDMALFQKTIDVNLTGTFRVMCLAAQLMEKVTLVKDDSEERGVIINTASIAAYDGQVGQVAYAASKAAVCAMTLPAARELARHAIRVMTIAPGVMQTAMTEAMTEEIIGSLEKTIPHPSRLGQSYEFATLVYHIIQNPYLNAEIIRLDAGLRMV